MRKEKEAIISGTKFKVTQLGFADGMELLTTLGHIIGPALSDPQRATSPAAIIGNIIGRLSFAEIMSITDKLAKSTRVEQEPGRWPLLEPEVDLAGNYDLTVRWLKFALEVNYGDFFAAGGLLQDVISPVAANPA
ncbi:hypothetical protein E6Q11_06195 [Candidatus Dojkabacteria bacterium]|uniref:Uncharacterized protein n=1 Tax=Candidatus Dojkabacteria bacterium TaxID=2099670 RepID=A0A5C7J4P4_9BACT|nr:MAG: hypothetical protein E6Q11_06195 [Candidatus Dojkabacteria bacterium]